MISLIPRIVAFDTNGKATAAGCAAEFARLQKDAAYTRIIGIPTDHYDFVGYDVRGKTEEELRDLASLDSRHLQIIYTMTPAEAATKRAAIIKAWGEAESRIGKFVNLDERTVRNFMTCPDNMLVESIRSELGKL